MQPARKEIFSLSPWVSIDCLLEKPMSKKDDELQIYKDSNKAHAPFEVQILQKFCKTKLLGGCADHNFMMIQKF